MAQYVETQPQSKPINERLVKALGGGSVPSAVRDVFGCYGFKGRRYLPYSSFFPTGDSS